MISNSDYLNSLEGYYEERDSDGKIIGQDIFYIDKIEDNSNKK